MRYLPLLILLFIAACSAPTRVVEDVRPLAAPDNMMYVIEDGQSKFLSITAVLDSNDVLLRTDTLTTIATKADVDGVEAGSFYNNDGTFSGTRTATISAGESLVIADQNGSAFILEDGGNLFLDVDSLYLSDTTNFRTGYRMQWNEAWNSQVLTDLTFFPTGSGDFLITRGDTFTKRFETDPDGSITMHDTSGSAYLWVKPDGEVYVGAGVDNGDYGFQVAFVNSYFRDSVTFNGDVAFDDPVWFNWSVDLSQGTTFTLNHNTNTDWTMSNSGGSFQWQPSDNLGIWRVQNSAGTDLFAIDSDASTTFYRTDGSDAMYVDLTSGNVIVNYEGIFGGSTDNGAYDLQVNGDQITTGVLYADSIQLTPTGTVIRDDGFGGMNIYTENHFEVWDSDGDRRFAIFGSTGAVELNDTTGSSKISITNNGTVLIGPGGHDPSFDIYFGGTEFGINTDTTVWGPGSSELRLIIAGTGRSFQPVGEIGTELYFEQSNGNDRIRIDWDDEVGIFGTDGITGITINSAGEALFGATTDNGAYDLQVNGLSFFSDGIISQDSVVVTTVATNDDPIWVTKQARVATTDGSTTEIFRLAIPEGTLWYIEAYAVARRTGGTAGTAGDYATYKWTATVNTEGGLTSELSAGLEIQSSSIEAQAGWDFNANVSSNDYVFSVVGAADNNITWHVTYKYMYLGS